MNQFILAMIGFVSVIISGMGIGGGAVLIPALIIFLNFSQTNAQGMNLVYFIPCAVISIIIHCKNKLIEFSVFKKVIVLALLGGIFGAWIAVIINQGILRKIFAVFLIIMGTKEILTGFHIKSPFFSKLITWLWK